MSVNLFGIEDRLARDLQSRAGPDFAVEAGAMPGVAGRFTYLVHFHEQAVSVAVDANFLDLLDVAGALAFEPERLARAAPKDAFLEAQRAAHRLFVHIGHHQDGAVLG